MTSRGRHLKPLKARLSAASGVVTSLTHGKCAELLAATLDTVDDPRVVLLVAQGVVVRVPASFVQAEARADVARGVPGFR
jgi:hypothetical protein